MPFKIHESSNGHLLVDLLGDVNISSLINALSLRASKANQSLNAVIIDIRGTDNLESLPLSSLDFGEQFSELIIVGERVPSLNLSTNSFSFSLVKSLSEIQTKIDTF